MKKLLSIFFFMLNTLVFSQEYFIINIGRPREYDYQIAQKIISKDYNFEIVNLSDMNELEYYDSLNNILSKKLLKKYNQNWETIFYDKISEQVEINKKIKNLVQEKTKSIHHTQNKYYIERKNKCSKNKYIVATFIENNTRDFENLYKYTGSSVVNLKKQIVKYYKWNSRKPIYFENGISSISK